MKFHPEDLVLFLDFGVGCGFSANVIGLSPSSFSLFFSSRVSSTRLPREDEESLGVTMPRWLAEAEARGRIEMEVGDEGATEDLGDSGAYVRVGDLGGTGGGGVAERGGVR